MSRNLPDAGGEQELWAQGTASAEAQSLGFQETSRHSPVQVCGFDRMTWICLDEDLLGILDHAGFRALD